MANKIEKIYEILKQDIRLVAVDGSLLKNGVYDLASCLDADLQKRSMLRIRQYAFIRNREKSDRGATMEPGSWLLLCV